jgi:histone H3
LDVLRHDSDTLGVDGTQVGVLEESNQVGLCSLLQSQDSSRLETEIGLEILGDLANETLEGSLADQEIGRLLVLADLSKSHGSGTVTVGLLDSSGGGGGLTGSLGGKLLAGGLSSGRLAGSLKSERVQQIVRDKDVFE